MKWVLFTSAAHKIRWFFKIHCYLQHQLFHLVLFLKLFAVRYWLVVVQAHHAVCPQGLPVVLVIDVQDTVFAVILRELQALLSRAQGHKAQAGEEKQQWGQHLPRGRHSHTSKKKKFWLYLQDAAQHSEWNAAAGWALQSWSLKFCFIQAS